VLLASLIDGVSRNVGGLRAAARRDREARRATVPLGWTVTAEIPSSVRSRASAASRQRLAGPVRKLPDGPVNWTTARCDRADDRAISLDPRPRAYYVPPHLGDIVERLRRHGILVEEITAAFPLRATRPTWMRRRSSVTAVRLASSAHRPLKCSKDTFGWMPGKYAGTL